MAFALKRVIPLAALASAQSWRLGDSIEDQPPFGMRPQDFQDAAERPNATNSVPIWGDLLSDDDKKKDDPNNVGVALDDLDWMLRISVIADVPIDGESSEEGSDSRRGDVTQLTIMSLTGPQDNPGNWNPDDRRKGQDQDHHHNGVATPNDPTPNDPNAPNDNPENHHQEDPNNNNNDGSWQDGNNNNNNGGQAFDDGKWDEEEHNRNRIWDDATWNPKRGEVAAAPAHKRFLHQHFSDACVIVMPGLGNDATRKSQDDNGTCEELSKQCRDDLQKRFNEQKECDSISLPGSCSDFFVNDASSWASTVSLSSGGSRFFAYASRPEGGNSDQSTEAYEEAVTHVWPVLIRWNANAPGAEWASDGNQQQNNDTVLRCIRASDIKRESTKPNEVPDRDEKGGEERTSGGDRDRDQDNQNGLGSGQDGSNDELNVASGLNGAGVTGLVGIAACILAGLIAF